jgi:hypothetical protein
MDLGMMRTAGRAARRREVRSGRLQRMNVGGKLVARQRHSSGNQVASRRGAGGIWLPEATRSQLGSYGAVDEYH